MSSLRKSERGRRPLLVILRSEATKNLLRSIRQIVTRADSLRSLSRADQATQSNRGRSLAALGMTERERGARDDKRTLFTGLQPGHSRRERRPGDAMVFQPPSEATR